ncbi:MAG: hypothetical protein AAGH79_18075 [Bacteroidota bacterium]
MTYSVFFLLVASCGSSSMKKEATVENRQTEPHPAPYEYGTGDIVYMGYLDQSDSMWFTTS